VNIDRKLARYVFPANCEALDLGVAPRLPPPGRAAPACLAFREVPRDAANQCNPLVHIDVDDFGFGNLCFGEDDSMSFYFYDEWELAVYFSAASAAPGPR